MGRVVSVGLAAMLLLSACEDPFVDPFVEGKHFTVYGYLNIFESDHVLRVIPVRRFPERITDPSDPQSEIDAEVFTTNLSTNETTRWTHHLVELDDGSYGHVFSASFIVRPTVTYRLTVRRVDGAESTAETTVPGNLEAEALPATVLGDSVYQVIRWKKVASMERVALRYCASPKGGPVCADNIDGKTGVTILYVTRKGYRNGSDWEIPVQLSRDFAVVRSVAGLDPDVPLEFKGLELRVITRDEKWTVYDNLEVFAQPNTLNNVENGFGYWGSTGLGVKEWVPDESALEVIHVSVPE